MKQNGLIFVIAFVLAFGGGYLLFNKGETADLQTTTETEDVQTDEAERTDDNSASDEQASVEFETLNMSGCISCHAVNSLDIEGGTTGPDLSNTYNDIEGKHGVDLDSFLQEPTSAVMSGVIEADPLSDEEREAIIDVLKKAAEQ